LDDFGAFSRASPPESQAKPPHCKRSFYSNKAERAYLNSDVQCAQRVALMGIANKQ
jgi:hypothetical protein